MHLLRNRLEGLLYTNERVYKEFGNMLEAGANSDVKDALERGRSLLESEDTAVLQQGIAAVNEASRHLTQVMLMDPKQFLAMMGRGEGEGGAG
jgi:GTP cyclohydrolase I